MCRIRLKRRLNQLQDTLDNLYTFIKTKEYENLKKDSLDLKEEQELLSHISFKLKNIRVFDGEEVGDKIIKIYYEQPIITLHYKAEDNSLSKDETFYAINRLNLTDLSQIAEIQETLKNIKNDY